MLGVGDASRAEYVLPLSFFPCLLRTKFSIREKRRGKEINPSTQRTLTIPFKAYYIPRSALSPSVTLAQIPNRSTYCEWKGHATYWKITHQPQSESQGRAPTEEPRGKVWSYETPNPAFGALKGHLCFYVSDDVPWEGFVDGEKVRPQPGDYYGGWWTSDLEGVQKGGPGTEGW